MSTASSTDEESTPGANRPVRIENLVGEGGIDMIWMATVRPSTWCGQEHRGVTQFVSAIDRRTTPFEFRHRPAISFIFQRFHGSEWLKEHAWKTIPATLNE